MSKFTLWLALLLLPATATAARAHGTTIAHRQATAIEIRATYDNGEPMRDAQVVVYAPDDPSEPWLRGSTDERGRFVFVPEAEQTGEWDVKVRQSGHGDIVSIPVEPGDGSAIARGNWSGGGYSPLQKVAIGAVGVWGFVGTALFFARKKDD